MSSCECRWPPGGRLQCNDDQLAVCRVDDNGVPSMECRNHPGGLRGDAMRRWILREITGRASVRGPLTEAELTILAAGWYVDAASGTQTCFGLPVIEEEGTLGMSAGA